MDSDSLIDTACLKLTCVLEFDLKNTGDILAVLSQRFCIDPVLTNAEAIRLADRSVSDYMRLLTGISPDRRVLYTYLPSEPILVLAAASIIYKRGWKPILDAFSKRLCRAGLVDKGLMGELAARILLIIARDFATQKHKVVKYISIPDLLKPVSLLDFLDHLFGTNLWCGSADRIHFVAAFSDMYVNFTHWIVTQDSLPEKPDQ
jgi:hypothetical protein